MDDWQQRQRAIMGDGLTRLGRLHGVVAGLGGVGSAAAEALCRGGVGALTVVDFDVLQPTNKNRQLLALDSTIGLQKTAVAAQRYKDINPACIVTPLALRIDEQSVEQVFEHSPDFVIDAVDTVSAKLLLIQRSRELGIPVISCMGTANRTDPGAFHIGTAAGTAGCGCPLARVMRRELSRRQLADTAVLYSTQLPVKPQAGELLGSVSWVPPVAGYMMAGYMLNMLVQ